MAPTQAQLLRQLVDTLHSQISIYTGKRSGGLAVLQDWYSNHYIKKKDTICGACNRNIEKKGHSDNCDIVKEYFTHFKKE